MVKEKSGKFGDEGVEIVGGCGVWRSIEDCGV
jgi:hypothetical protein